MRNAIRADIADVWTRVQVPVTAVFTPHLSIVYANTDGPTVAIIQKLNGVQNQAVTVTVTQASLNPPDAYCTSVSMGLASID
jgi:hypothetical protein